MIGVPRLLIYLQLRKIPFRRCRQSIHACRTCVRFYFKHSYLPHKTGWYVFDGTLFTMTCSIPVSGTHIINDYMVEETIGISRPLLNHRFCAILSDHNVSLKVQNDSEIGGEIGGDLVLRIWCECKKRFLLLLSDFFTKKDILSFIHSLSLSTHLSRYH